MLPTLFLASALAAWEPAPVTLPRDPVRKLVPAGASLLVLLPRQLYVVTGDRPRRAFALTVQTDALVDADAGTDGWWLLSRRQLWRSEDEGYSWRAVASLPAKEKNEFLALGVVDGRRVVASRAGLKRSDLAGAGALGHVRLDAAESDRGRLLLATAFGLLALPDRKYALAGAPVPTAFVRDGAVSWLAAGRRLYRCEAACTGADGGEVTSLAAFEGAYWAATTDGVRRYAADGGSVSDASAGLESPRGGALAGDGTRLWLAAGGRLFAWAAPATGTTARTPEPIALPYAPPMERVRRWVLETHGLDAGGEADWRRRARWRAAAPALDVSVRRSVDDKTATVVGNSISLSATESRVLIGPDGTSRTRSSGGAVDFGVALRWQLDGLVFDAAELTVSNEAEDRFRLRESVLLDATRLYYDRRRAERQLLTETDAARRGELVLRVAELTAELDFYTGGRFSADLGEAAR